MLLIGRCLRKSQSVTIEHTLGSSYEPSASILTTFIKPAARAAGLGFVNWRCLRTSRATWMIEAGANPKDVQGQMRHSCISTTMDIYAQFIPESARRAMDKTREMVERRQAAMQLATEAVQ